MPATKKQLEILLMSYFRECYSGFPKGKVIPSESPDFIVRENRKKTGIELTRLNPVNKKNPGKEKEKNNELIERIIDSAKNLFDPTSPFRLFVKFLFSEKYHVKPGREFSLTVKLANSVRQTVKNNNPENFFYKYVPAPLIPYGLKKILIVNHPVLQTSIWERFGKHGISENILIDIKESVTKKDEKLILYQKQWLDYYWLLITTDMLHGAGSSNLPRKILNMNLSTGFHRIFILDIIRSAVIQIV